MTAFNQVLANINRHTTLTPAAMDKLRALFSIRQLRKKEFLLREGEICTHEYYVNSGCVRTYYKDAKEMEHNLYFAIEDWWVSDLYSRTCMAPSFCNIVALEPTELVQISHAALEDLLREEPLLERFFRVSYQQSLVSLHLKNLQLLYMSGEERYIHFRKTYPGLAERIPQKHIATFLGLTPEFFNTIHAKVLRMQ